MRSAPRRALCPWLPAAALLLASACTRHDLLVVPPVAADTTLPALEERPISQPDLSSLRASIPTIEGACGPVSYFPLTNGKRVVGTVNVTNDAKNIYVTYWVPVKHAWISDTRLAVGRSAALIPRDASGNPAPWSFPDSSRHAPPTTSFTHAIPLARAGVQAGQVAYLSAMAGVVRPRAEDDYGGSWEWLVMWGIGTTRQTLRSVVHEYKVIACPGMPAVPTTPVGTRGVVTITFDDGYASVYANAFPVLKSLGLKGNLAVNPLPIDEQWGDYMRLGQVKEIYGSGWSVVSHTVDHKELTSLAPEALEAEIRDAKLWIERNGFGPSSVFIVPFHSWGARERAVVAKYHKYARGHSIGEWTPERYQALPLTQPLDLTAFEPEFAPWRTAQGRALTMEKVKHAVDNGLFLDLLFHRVEAADVATFRELMSQVAQYKANVRTWKEVAQ
jgi:peptidoglycan/xylan/chitin deacetylase (PgdA/CDA1 family)